MLTKLKEADPMKIVDITIAGLFAFGCMAILFVVVNKKPVKECPLNNGQTHVWSEYKPDGTLVCSYQQVTPGRVILKVSK